MDREDNAGVYKSAMSSTATGFRTAILALAFLVSCFLQCLQIIGRREN